MLAVGPADPERVERDRVSVELERRQVAACANEIGYTLREIADLNLAKLGDRDHRGVIVGEGDDR